jgi:hypothetical protein
VADGSGRLLAAWWIDRRQAAAEREAIKLKLADQSMQLKEQTMQLKEQSNLYRLQLLRLNAERAARRTSD